MHHYRVTRYDPALRNLEGFFTKETWTFYAQIGQVFDGVEFRREDYLRTEAAYLAAIAAFLAEAGVECVRLDGLQNAQAYRLPDGVAPGAWLAPEPIEAFARMALREECWGRLVAPGRAYVHFGWDYYLYIGVPRRCPTATAQATAQGLFVEDFRSPYLRQRPRRHPVG